MSQMAKKAKKKFSAVKTVKELARERLGSPRPVQKLDASTKKKAGEKHKKNLAQLLSEAE